MSFAFAPDTSREQLDQLLESEPFEYQRMPLPFGLSTKGQDRSGTSALIFPPRLDGESVLDIGCCYGFFCYEAMARGAASATGIELDEDRHRHAQKLQPIYRDPIELKRGDFLQLLPGHTYDHVLFLNVVHHLVDPTVALRVVANATRKRAVIEFPTFADKRFRKTLPPLVPRLLNRLPLTGVALLDKMDQTYVFSREAMRRILVEHGRLFASVEFAKSPIEGRLLAICHKA